MRLKLCKNFCIYSGILVSCAATPPDRVALGFHLEQGQIESVSEAVHAVTVCAVAAIDRIDDQVTSAEVIARVIEPTCRHYLQSAVELACRAQEPDYCKAVQEILDPEILYPQIVLQHRAFSRRRPNS